MHSPSTFASDASVPLPALQPDVTHRTYVFMGALMLAIVAVAFGSRYFARPDGASPLPLFVHVHALLFVGWLALFTCQAVLAYRGRFRYHRQLGIGAFSYAILIVFVGFYTAIEGARRGHNPGGMAPSALAFMIVPWADIVLFAALTAASWSARKRPDFHKRLVLFATLGGFLWPAITRLPFLPMGPQRAPYMFAILVAVLLIPIVTSLITRRRVHWLDVTCGLLIFASLPLRRWIGTTDGWQQFAFWLIG